MSEMSVTDARAHISEVVSRAASDGQTTFLTRRGRRVAAVVPIEVWQAYEEAEDAADVQAAREALAEDGPAVSLEEFRSELAAQQP